MQLNYSCYQKRHALFARNFGRFWYLLFFYQLIPTAFSYSTHPGQKACSSMIPDHGVVSQTSPPPFTIQLSSTSVLGYGHVDITFKSSSINFTGFFIQVRKVGDNIAAGKFDVSAEMEGKIGSYGCPEKDTSVGHVNPTPKSTVTARWFAPNEEGDYQVFYTGVQNKTTFWSFVQHTEQIHVTWNKNIKTTTTHAPKSALVLRWREIYKACREETRGCFGMPQGCIKDFDEKSKQPKTCDLIMTWRKNGTFELTGRTGQKDGSGYIALGISNDKKMGDDSVVGCTFSKKQKGKVKIERYYNLKTSRDNTKYTENPKLALVAIRSANIDGNLFCTFAQTNHAINGFTVDFGKYYTYLIAKGATFTDTGLGVHLSVDRAVSPKQVHISHYMSLEATNDLSILHFHGTVTIFGWIVFASCGTFVSRYYRQTRHGKLVFGKPSWLVFHVSCMLITGTLTISGIISMIWFKGGLIVNTHAVLGLCVGILLIVQGCLGIRSTSWQLSTRIILGWIHFVIGQVLPLLAYVCIILAFYLNQLAKIKSMEGAWIGVVVGVIIFQIVMHLVMTYHTYLVDGEMGAEPEFRNRALKLGPIRHNGQIGEAPGTMFRYCILAFYLIAVLIFAALLTYLVFQIS